jgi:hypothetical protein
MGDSENVPFGSAFGVHNLVAQDALRAAAIIVLDEAFGEFGELWHHSEVEDLARTHNSADARKIFARQSQIDADPFMVWGRLPRVYESRYATFDFLKNWIVTLSTVGWKLAQPEAQPLANVGEELALHVLLSDAIGKVEDLENASPEAGEALRGVYEEAFEDTDFLVLFRLDDSADLEPGGRPWAKELRFEDWLRPFGSGVDRGVPHPFLLDE